MPSADTDVVTLDGLVGITSSSQPVENCLTPGTGCAEGTESYNLVMQRIDSCCHLTTLFGDPDATDQIRIQPQRCTWLGIRQTRVSGANRGQMAMRTSKWPPLTPELLKVVVGMNDSRFNHKIPLPDTRRYRSTICGGGPSYFNAYVLGAAPRVYGSSGTLLAKKRMPH